MYHYAANNPVRYTDPDGRSDCGIYDKEGNYSDKLVKDTIESATKQNMNDIINNFNKDKDDNEKIDKETLRDLFFNPDKAEELLTEREDLHKDLRYQLNSTSPTTSKEAKQDGWKKLPWYKSIFHNPFKNDKYVSPDGHREGVYDKKTGNANVDKSVMATFNFYDPNSQSSNHVKADVIPYQKWGN